jgi:hypothetical protein
MGKYKVIVLLDKSLVDPNNKTEDNSFFQFEGELEIIVQPVHSINLKVFWDYKTEMSVKIYGSWVYYKRGKLKWIKIESNDPSNSLSEINIEDSKIAGVSHYSEDEKVIWELSFDSIRYAFENTSQGNEKNEFFLNNNTSLIVARNYNHNPIKLPWQDDWKYQPTHKNPQGFAFGMIRYKLDFEIKLIEEKTFLKDIIVKMPRIIVEQANISAVEIRKHVNMICKLSSFYCHEKIDYNFSRIFAEGKLYIEIKNELKNTTPAEDGIFWVAFRRNPDNLILNVNCETTLNNEEFIYNIIDKFNNAMNADGETRFMLLYNILEQIRTASGINVKSKYSFNVKDKNEEKELINEPIRQLLNDISDKIKDDGNNEPKFFKDSINGKISQLKYKTMPNQFVEFFKIFNLDQAKYRLDFNKLFDIRNTFFHGNALDQDQKIELMKVNDFECLPKFVGHAFLKYLGIDDLEKINLLKD